MNCWVMLSSLLLMQSCCRIRSSCQLQWVSNCWCYRQLLLVLLQVLQVLLGCSTSFFYFRISWTSSTSSTAVLLLLQLLLLQLPLLQLLHSRCCFFSFRSFLNRCRFRCSFSYNDSFTRIITSEDKLFQALISSIEILNWLAIANKVSKFDSVCSCIIVSFSFFAVLHLCFSVYFKNVAGKIGSKISCLMT